MRKHLPGLGSVNKLEIDNKTREIVKAGLHWSFKISRQILPFLLICKKKSGLFNLPATLKRLRPFTYIRMIYFSSELKLNN